MSDLTQLARERGAKAAATATKAKADEACADLAPIVWGLRDSGSSQQAIADELNSQGPLHAARANPGINSRL